VLINGKPQNGIVSNKVENGRSPRVITTFERR
jgi:hypothetical protein